MGQKKVFTRDPIFGGSCVAKSLPLKDSPINRVLHVAQRIKKQYKLGVTKVAQSIKTAKIGVHSSKSERIWVKTDVI